MSFELTQCYSVEELLQGLSKKEKVVYTVNGNRAVSGEAFLKRIEKIAPLTGVKRVANISELSPTNYPVYQSSRPQVYYHAFLGQNTGSQGKGASSTQAKISCLMETIEGYCAEPRNIFLRRGSYNFLKDHHVIVPPSRFTHILDAQTVSADEPLMWSEAYCVELDQKVLIPAETIYFPFLAHDYSTRHIFPQSSNGLASGSSYLEATIHALYELVERHYITLFEKHEIQLEAMFEEEIPSMQIQGLRDKIGSEYELQIFALERKGKKNLPMVLCILVGEERCYLGWGCCFTLDIAIERAISEALQSFATIVSGAREDMTAKVKPSGNTFGSRQPEYRTLRIKDYRKRILDKKFSNLRDEFEALVKWIHELGAPKIFLANLTRHGIDIPVIKALAPGLRFPDDLLHGYPTSTSEVIAKQFPNVGQP